MLLCRSVRANTLLVRFVLGFLSTSVLSVMVALSVMATLLVMVTFSMLVTLSMLMALFLLVTLSVLMALSMLFATALASGFLLLFLLLGIVKSGHAILIQQVDALRLLLVSIFE